MRAAARPRADGGKLAAEVDVEVVVDHVVDLAHDDLPKISLLQ
jgi:hypothetical protein